MGIPGWNLISTRTRSEWWDRRPACVLGVTDKPAPRADPVTPVPPRFPKLVDRFVTRLAGLAKAVFPHETEYLRRWVHWQASRLMRLAHSLLPIASGDP